MPQTFVWHPDKFGWINTCHWRGEDVFYSWKQISEGSQAFKKAGDELGSYSGHQTPKKQRTDKIMLLHRNICTTVHWTWVIKNHDIIKKNKTLFTIQRYDHSLWTQEIIPRIHSALARVLHNNFDPELQGGHGEMEDKQQEGLSVRRKGKQD